MADAMRDRRESTEASGNARRNISLFLARVAVMLAFWMLLTWSISPQEVAVGLVVAIVAALLLGDLLLPGLGRLFQLSRYFWLFFYVPVLAYYVVKANLDVAYRVLHPDLPIRPGIVEARTTLHTPMARTFLANSITLTPGTLTVDLVGERLYVHWINVASVDPEETTRVIVSRFERILKRVFE
jgi:multicomponent Na+:H+ antiporter subunit E